MGVIFAVLFMGVLLGFLGYIATADFTHATVSEHQIHADDNYVYAYCEKECLINITGSDNVIEVIIVYDVVHIFTSGDRNIISLPQNTKYILNDAGAGNYVAVRQSRAILDG